MTVACRFESRSFELGDRFSLLQKTAGLLAMQNNVAIGIFYENGRPLLGCSNFSCPNNRQSSCGGINKCCLVEGITTKEPNRA